jgi:2-amino-4-hydroxy-6-hydroxymethyldihydropteridine diphosphokinase
LNYVIALGSNLGDRIGYLEMACLELSTLVAVSSIFETAPVGGPVDQGAYLNMAVVYESNRTPREVLEECQRIETLALRRRTERFGPRTLDLDIVAAEDLVIDDADLVIPHPRAKDRAFVLAPVFQIDRFLARRLSVEMTDVLEEASWREGDEIIDGVWLRGALEL